MFDRIILILLVSLILMGAATIAVPLPILWAMGCLTFLALSVVLRSQKQA